MFKKSAIQFWQKLTKIEKAVFITLSSLLILGPLSTYFTLKAKPIEIFELQPATPPSNPSPTPTPSPTTCSPGIIKFAVDKYCGNSSFYYAKYTCKDRYSIRDGNSNDCYSISEWLDKAKSVCNTHVSCNPPSPPPSPVAPPSATPLPSPSISCGNQYPSGCPENYYCGCPIVSGETTQCYVESCYPRPTSRPTPRPSFNPTPRPSFNPTPKPSFNPTPKPSFNPTPRPSFRPTPTPTSKPTYSESSLFRRLRSYFFERINSFIRRFR